MGTSQLAASIFEKLCERHEVVGVFTRPDAIRGRGKKLVASPVKSAATARGVTVYERNTLAGDEPLELVKALDPEAICVASYGCILPQPILDLPPCGCLNVHTSLLPRWRGAAPIERAILAGDHETGVCIMRMEAGLDTGPYCVRATVPVGERYLAEIEESLAEVGAEALIRALEEVSAGAATWRQQDDEGVVYAEKIGKGELDFGPAETAFEICAKVRASNESHPSKTNVAGKAIAVTRAHAVEPGEIPGAESLHAGEAAFMAKRLVIAAADGIVELEQVKPDGKKIMPGRAFASGIQGVKGATVAWGKA